jgi:hypothetical protein
LDNFEFLSLETLEKYNYLFAGRTGTITLPPMKVTRLNASFYQNIVFSDCMVYIQQMIQGFHAAGSVNLRAGGRQITRLQISEGQGRSTLFFLLLLLLLPVAGRKSTLSPGLILMAHATGLPGDRVVMRQGCQLSHRMKMSENPDMDRSRITLH